MGSSFAAGPGLGPAEAGSPERCHRTTANYATLVAARLDLRLDDVSCGGATTEHILGPWNELPPQISAVTSDTQLVTVTIGGNDLNYVGNLFAATCPRGSTMHAGKAAFTCPEARLPNESDYARVKANLHEIAARVHRQAPHARLVFIQYVTLVPGTACDKGRLSAGLVEPIRELGLRLAAITAKVAKETGAGLVSADELSRDHTPCDPEPWSNGFTPQMASTQSVPWHPNRAGMAGIAKALEEELAR